MPRTYLLLTDDEKHEILVQYHQAQERDHYCHSVNKTRYQSILSESDVAPEFRKRVQELLNETEQRLHEVELILDKTGSQLPTVEHIDAAKQRLKAAMTSKL